MLGACSWLQHPSPGDASASALWCDVRSVRVMQFVCSNPSFVCLKQPEHGPAWAACDTGKSGRLDNKSQKMNSYIKSEENKALLPPIPAHAIKKTKGNPSRFTAHGLGASTHNAGHSGALSPAPAAHLGWGIGLGEGRLWGMQDKRDARQDRGVSGQAGARQSLLWKLLQRRQTQRSWGARALRIGPGLAPLARLFPRTPAPFPLPIRVLILDPKAIPCRTPTARPRRSSPDPRVIRQRGGTRNWLCLIPRRRSVPLSLILVARALCV